MSMNKVLTIISLSALLWLAASCKKEAQESSDYLNLLGSNWGIGVTLGMNREQVEAVLKVPDFEEESRNKLSIDLIWIPGTTSAHGLHDSQLRLTLTDDKLTGISNVRKVAESESDVIEEPPFLVKPAAGATIGSLKSDFVNQLGNPGTELTDTLIWDYESLAGERLRITAVFSMDAVKGAAVCNSIAVQTGKRLGASQAEEKKEKPSIY
jgi:hypothetical protein